MIKREIKYWLYRFRNSKVALSRGVSLSEAKLAKFTRVLDNALIISSSVDSYTYIGRDSKIIYADIGRFCSIADEVRIGLGKHPLDLVSTSPLFYKDKTTFGFTFKQDNRTFEEHERVVIDQDVWIGFRAIVLDGVKVGTGAVIAAGAVVTKDVPPYAVVAGVPAKILKFRCDPKTIEERLNSKWWLEYE